MPDQSMDWVGQTLSGGRYRVDAKLGEGGMGFVYKVWDRNLDTEVVVKAPRKSMVDDPEFASRFALEIRSLVKLSHPNIVKVSDVGEHDGLPFAVMQYLSGGTLDERLEYGREGRPLPSSPSSVSYWLPGIAAALDFIHAKGYIHRDVKPANILFDAHGHPYLSDFGVAKVLSDVEASGSKKGPSGMTGIGIVLGTPEYMAPELIMGTQFDGKVDQYALAATVYEILCGRRPFVGDTATAILVRQTTQEPPSLDELAGSGQSILSRPILRGLAKKPADRYRSCVEFSNALLDALARAGASRPTPGRLACPSCGVSFTAPADLGSFKGKKSRCQGCNAPFRVAMDGLSLLKINPDAAPSPSGSVEVEQVRPTPGAGRTVQLDAPYQVQHAPAQRANRTVKLDAMPVAGTPSSGTARPNATMKMAAIPSSRTVATDEPLLAESGPRLRLPLVIGGVGLAAAALLGVAFMAFRPSASGTSVASVATPSTLLKIEAPELLAPTLPVVPPPVAPVPKPPPIAQPPSPASVSPPDPGPPAPMEVTESTPASPPNRPEPEPEPLAREAARVASAPTKVRLKSATSKEALKLKQIVAAPADWLDEEVSPSDVVLFDTSIGRFGGEVAIRSKDGAYKSHENPQTPFRIVLNPQIQSQLNDKLNAGLLVMGEYPAVLRMKIVRDSDGFVGVIDWIELLHYIDPRSLAKINLYKDVYCVVHLSTDGPNVGRTPNYKQWQSRVQIMTTNVRNQYEKAPNPAVYVEWGRNAANPVGKADFFHKWIMGHFR